MSNLQKVLESLYVIRKNNPGGTAAAFLGIIETIFTWLVFESKIILST